MQCRRLRGAIQASSCHLPPPWWWGMATPCAVVVVVSRRLFWRRAGIRVYMKRVIHVRAIVRIAHVSKMAMHTHD
jgi:hypothetical protein